MQTQIKPHSNPKPPPPKTPVTILTGFLGSGKTTLLNHILTHKHGLKIAVIENQFGEVGVDADLVKQAVHAEEQIVQTLNGCICCTVRGDLKGVLVKLLVREGRVFDAVVIETTGMANPTPLVQTFFMEPEIQRITYLDGIITVVDAKHIIQHLNQKFQKNIENQSAQQIAFADKVIINKIDLVNEKQLQDVIKQIKNINASAEVIKSQYSKVDPNVLLGIQTFKIQNVLRFKPDFLKIQSSQRIGKNRTKSNQQNQKQHSQEYNHSHNHENDHQHPNQPQNTHQHNHQHDHQHQNHEHDHSHYLHSNSISSCGCIIPQPLNLSKFRDMLDDLIQQKSTQLYRYKGVINVAGMDSPYVFQGVHEILTGAFVLNGWEEAVDRRSSMVFIGRNLDREAILGAVRGCVAGKLELEVGDCVQCKIYCGADGWKTGTIIKLWYQGYPYLVKLQNGTELPFPDHSSGRIKLIQKTSEVKVDYKQPRQLLLLNIQKMVEVGMQLFKLQRYSEAYDKFKQCIEYVDKNVSSIQASHADIKSQYHKINKYIITCLLRLQKFLQSLQNCQNLLKQTPKDSNLHYLYAVNLINLKKFNQALQVLQNAYEMDEDNEQLLMGIRKCHRIINQEERKERLREKEKEKEKENDKQRDGVQNCEEVK